MRREQHEDERPEDPREPMTPLYDPVLAARDRRFGTGGRSADASGDGNRRMRYDMRERIRKSDS